MTEKAKSLASRIDPVLWVEPSTRRIYIQLDKVFGSLELSLSLIPELVHAWRGQIKVMDADAQGEAECLYLPLLMLPDFLDGMPAGLLSQDGHGVADEYQRLIRGMKFTSLLITQIRQSGLQISMDNLPAGMSEQDVQDVAAFIAEQPSRRCHGYQCSPVNYKISFNSRQVL